MEGVEIKPFVLTPQVLDFYCRTFPLLRKKGILWLTTSISGPKIKSALLQMSERAKNAYFLVYVNKKICGHFGLAEISFEGKYARFGFCLLPSFFNKRGVFPKIMDFVLDYARKKLSLKTIVVELPEKSFFQQSKLIEFFLNSGFVFSPDLTHLWLKL